MISYCFDRNKPYRYVMYGRMSSKQQNERSPDQQFDSISMLIERQQLPWQEVKRFRDDGISGKFIKKRPSFQAMLRLIESGTANIDLILVDTFERFGRAEELHAIRRELEVRHGVLILTADSNFADPTTTQDNSTLSLKGSGQPAIIASKGTTSLEGNVTPFPKDIGPVENLRSAFA